MIDNRSKQRKVGVVLGYINFLVKMGTQLIYVPIMLSILGQNEYGVYQLVASIISYLSLLNFGFGGSYLRFYAQCNGDTDKEKKLNGTFLTVFTVFAVFVLVVGLLISANAQVILGNKLTSDELTLSKVLLVILTINMALTFPISVFSSIISSQEAFIFQKVVELLKNAVNPFLTIIILLLGKGSVGLVCVTTFITILAGIVNVWYVIAKIGAKFSFKKLDFNLIKNISAFSFFIFLNSIIDQINWNVDKFLLGRLIGSAAIAIYSVGAQINSIYTQASDMTASVMATQVNLIVANNKTPLEKLNALFIKVGRIQAYIVLAIVSGFLVLGNDFITLWAGKNYGEAYYITLFLIVPAAIPLMQSLGVDIQRALNKHQVRSIIYAGLSIGNIIISIPLIYKFGASGAAFGTAISLLLGNGLIMNIVYEKYIGLNIVLFWKQVFPIIIVSLIPILCGLIINYFFVRVSWYMLILKGLIFIIIYLVSEYLIAMNKEERNIVTNVFARG
ncbi:lipopolysaccharide biosynthesis protein [Oliverpabstia intestinalis]|uniref:lipopolysaccharide biosynthesis protein n=1 Tax=Oliverpabstia intestinalis TaxID=2606633 RepID=UPI003F9DB12A